jgi:streptomycin 3"-adenylyltransferase
MVQIASRREKHSARFEVELAEVPAVGFRQVWNIRVRDDASMPPAEDELTEAKISRGEHALALTPGIQHDDVCNHPVRSSDTHGIVTADTARDFARILANASSDALREAVAGVILHGSLTSTSFVPDQSDIDLLVIVHDPLNDDQITRLREAVEAVRTDAPAPVDLRVVSRSTALSPSKAPFMDVYLRIRPDHSQLLVETRHAEPDLVVELSISRASGQSLLGPAPDELIAEVPRRLVLEADEDQLAHWQAVGDDSEHAEIAVLTACRIWAFVEERRHASKDEAAEWVLSREPGLHVVRDALRHRQLDSRIPIEDGQVQQLLALVRARVKDELRATHPN